MGAFRRQRTGDRICSRGSGSPRHERHAGASPSRVRGSLAGCHRGARSGDGHARSEGDIGPGPSPSRGCAQAHRDASCSHGDDRAHGPSRSPSLRACVRLSSCKHGQPGSSASPAPRTSSSRSAGVHRQSRTRCYRVRIGACSACEAPQAGSFASRIAASGPALGTRFRRPRISAMGAILGREDARVATCWHTVVSRSAGLRIAW